MNIETSKMTLGAAEIEGIFNEFATFFKKTAESGSLPDAGTPSGITGEAALPTLPAPAGSLSLDTLLSAIGDEVRRQSCKAGVESLEAKAQQQKEINEKELQEMQERLEEMKKKSLLNGFLKAFKIIGMIVGAIASVASIVAGGITGNPLLIAAGVVGMAMTIDSIVSTASDGKYSIAAGFTELGKKMGMSDEAAQWFGFGMNMACMVASIALSLGAGFASSAGGAANAGSQAVRQATDVVNTTSRITNIASGVVTTAQGSATIAGAVIDYNISMSQADSKLLEAILERLRESIEMDKKLVEAEMERANALMADVREIVDNCVQAQVSVLTMNPGMA